MSRRILNLIPCVVLGIVTTIGMVVDYHTWIVALSGCATFLTGCAAMENVDEDIL